jgi:hypothetical protein
MGNLWYRFLSWFTGEPEKYLRCSTKHAFLVSRMAWTEEVVEYYQQCSDCGKEFYAD